MLQEPSVAGLGVMAYSLGAGDRERKKKGVDGRLGISHLPRDALGNPGKLKPVLPARASDHFLQLVLNLCDLVS